MTPADREAALATYLTAEAERRRRVVRNWWIAAAIAVASIVVGIGAKVRADAQRERAYDRSVACMAENLAGRYCDD